MGCLGVFPLYTEGFLAVTNRPDSLCVTYLREHLGY